MYRFFDLVIDSAVALPELPEAIAADLHRERIRFFLEDAECSSAPEPQWYQDAQDADGATTIAYGRVGQSYLLRFPGLIDFLVDPHSSVIRGYPAPGVELCTVRHLLLDQVLPRLVGQFGRLVLHASAVVYQGEALVFIGRSGWGKSTLAASFYRNGHRLLSDDCVLLEVKKAQRAQVVASYQGARLWPDAVEALFEREPTTLELAHYTRKKRLVIQGGEHGGECSVPLRAVFVLSDPVADPSPVIAVRPLRGSEAVMALVRRCFLLDPRDLSGVQDLLRCAGDILRAGIPVSLCDYPRVHGELGRVRDAVIDAIEPEKLSLRTD